MARLTYRRAEFNIGRLFVDIRVAGLPDPYWFLMVQTKDDPVRHDYAISLHRMICRGWRAYTLIVGPLVVTVSDVLQKPSK